VAAKSRFYEHPAICWGTHAVWLVLAWVVLVDYLSVDWETNPQYQFGWFVLPLAGYLFWLRWEGRPASEKKGGNGWKTPLVAGLVLFCLLLPVQEANPEWRFSAWSMGVAAVTATLGLLGLAGGRRWVFWFGFSIVFTLTAIPWPTVIEQGVTQNLMRFVASVTAEMLNWLGYAAEPVGNLIRFPSVTVGVDEACSGVRSLQSSFVVALFLGEYRRLAWGWRLGLILLALMFAFVLNVFRALFLSLMAADGGAGALASWHDTAGYAVLLLSFVLLLLCAWRMPSHAASARQAKAAGCPLIPDGRLGAAMLVLLLVAMGITSWWFASSGSKADWWKIHWPETAEEFAWVKVPERAEAMLRYSDGRGAGWNEEGLPVRAYVFDWKEGRASAVLASTHTPEVCLPAAGYRMAGSPVPWRFEEGKVDFPLNRYTFEGPAGPLHVFFGVAGTGREIEKPGTGLMESRLGPVFRRERQGAYRVVEILVYGSVDTARADQVARQVLRRLAQADGPGGGS
jgi:exosortase